ncbi:MAG: hypothetical protein N2235_04965 [Fischerella sp.]|nr:hypothetical protein [Fischerella sp.]
MLTVLYLTLNKRSLEVREEVKQIGSVSSIFGILESEPEGQGVPEELEAISVVSMTYHKEKIKLTHH